MTHLFMSSPPALGLNGLVNLTRLNLSCNQINNLTGESDSVYDQTLMNKSRDISTDVSFILL